MRKRRGRRRRRSTATLRTHGTVCAYIREGKRKSRVAKIREEEHGHECASRTNRPPIRYRLANVTILSLAKFFSLFFLCSFFFYFVFHLFFVPFIHPIYGSFSVSFYIAYTVPTRALTLTGKIFDRSIQPCTYMDTRTNRNRKKR